MKHDKEFTVIKWSHHSPDPGEQIWDVMEQKALITTKLFEAEELRQLWRENELQPGTNKSYVKCPLSVIHLEPPLFFLIQWRTSDYS